MDQKEQAQAYEYLYKLGQAVGRVRKNAPTVNAEDQEQIYPLIGFDFPKDDGIRVYWQGIDLPTKTFPYKETVEKIDDLKKIMKANAWGVADLVKRNPIKAGILLLLYQKEIGIIFENLLQEFSQVLRDVEQEPSMYCRAVRELYRVFSLEKGEMREQFGKIVCHFVEYDDAYRYRVQDAIVKLDKLCLAKKPIKELRRLLQLLADREGIIGMKKKWERLRTLVWFLRFKPKLVKEIQSFLINLNLEELKLDDVDKAHARRKPDYKWSF